MPIGKDQWEAFLAVVARNSATRERGEQHRAPSPTCEAFQGTGNVVVRRLWQAKNARCVRLHIATAKLTQDSPRYAREPWWD
jgi:hypothetical protein